MRAVFYGLGCLLLVATGAARGFAEETEPAEEAKPQTARWAQIELKGSYVEGAETPGLFGEAAESLMSGLARIRGAADDESIDGVVVRLNDPTIGWAKMHEFRQAITGLRDAGKRVYAWMDGGSSRDYLVATACDQILMPESGALMVLGVRAEVTFYKNLFDKLDIQPDMLRVGEFKSAAEPYTRTEMSPEFREEMESILDDYHRQIVSTIAESRGLSAEQVTAAIDTGPHTARAAKELGLIDAIAYEDQLDELLKDGQSDLEIEITRRYGKKKVDTDFSGFNGMINLMNLLMGVEQAARRSRAPKIAVVHATGMITTGRSSSGMLGLATVGSSTLIKAIRSAKEDENVKAVVLRVDSPGGSALASDLVWRELELLDKPFIASMGDTAASGGYYIAMGADQIFAEPGTLTGSIGVVGGKLAIGGLLEKVGVTTSVIERGKNSGAISVVAPFSPSERAAMMKLLNEVYDQFTRKAAAGRNMEHVELEKLARGRVYTGAQALEIGLVDRLGTLDDAVAHAKQLAGIDAGEKVDRLILPKPPSPLEELFGPIDSEVGGASAARVFRQVSPELARPLQQLDVINLLAREPRLTLLPYRLSIR